MVASLYHACEHVSCAPNLRFISSHLQGRLIPMVSTRTDATIPSWELAATVAIHDNESALRSLQSSVLWSSHTERIRPSDVPFVSKKGGVIL